MQVTQLGFIATVILSLVSPLLPKEQAPTPPSSPAVTAVVREQAVMKPEVLELQDQMKVTGTMPPAYWRDVAQCETASNWKDHGKWGGGLGIYVGTWRRFGGRQFSNHPADATVHEQMVIANRIAVLGYQTKNDYMTLDDRLNNRPYFRPRAGFFGWGCIANNRYLHPKNWRDNNRTEWRRGKKNVLHPLG